jgi:penicillin-binding protein 1A
VSSRSRVIIANPSDGGVLFWLGKLYAFAALVIVTLVLFAIAVAYEAIAEEAPEIPDLRRYAQVTPAVTRLYAADGTLMGEFAREWREITPYEKIPKRLVESVLAVEDHDFFVHGGIYFKGIARAVWANLTAGDFAQGGSTITQQVAKQFLGNEKSLTRKAKEAVMARRLESRYSKKAILAVYLNHIYFGAGAWGVTAAAHRYFQKKLDELTLAEMALIAGLPKAPSAYSPVRNPERAIERRNVVLDQMLKHGYATADEIAVAKAEPLALNVYRDVFPDRMPYYAEHVRRYVQEKYGNDALLAGGLRVEAAVEPTFDAGAYDNVDYGTRKQDKRQGWRGPEWHLDGAARETFIARQRELYGQGPLAFGKRYLALVTDVGGNGADVVIGDRELDLPLRNMKWAAAWQSGNADNDATIDSPRRALEEGDVVWVTRETRRHARFREWHLPDNHTPAWRPAADDSNWDDRNQDVVQLDQVPHPQGALFSADHRTGYVLAMVGGYDYARSEFNRAFQACRQPGSTYKPIYYSLALEEGYGFDTVLNDVPITIVDPITGLEWTPENLGDTLDGDVTLEYALVFSKNIPSVDIFKRLGATNVEAWARKLGFTTKIFPDDALALGASCTHLHEMAHAFAIFAREGKDVRWTFVRRVIDRDGNAVEDNTVPADPALASSDRLDRLAITAGVAPAQVIAPRTAFLITKLLAQMVKYGFTKTLRATDLHAAGKTGTSSDTHDTSFVAFTARHITAVWLGDDRKVRALGRNDAAFMTVVPLWARYMYSVARGYPNPEIPWHVPDGVSAKDRGEHKKGERTSPMDLVYRHAEKPPEPGEEPAPGVEGAAPPGT